MPDRVPPEWGLQSYRSFTGNDGVGISVNLTRNGGKVASVRNSGDGGCNSYSWFDQIARRDFEALGESRRWSRYQDVPDNVIDDMVDALEAKRWAARRARKGDPVCILIERTVKEAWLQKEGESDATLASFSDEAAMTKYLDTLPFIRWAPIDADGYPTTWTMGTQPLPVRPKEDPAEATA